MKFESPPARGGDGPDGGRRRFINWLLGSSVGALAASVFFPVLRFLSPPEVPEAATNEVEAGPANDPQLVEKGFKIVRFGAEPVILLKAGENDYRAFSATCTHLDCIVEYRKDRGVIWCNCHNGEYDLAGRNVAGPPPRPLARYDVHVVPGKGGQPATLVVEKA